MSVEQYNSPPGVLRPPDDILTMAVPGVDEFPQPVYDQGANLIFAAEGLRQRLNRAHELGLPVQVRISGLLLPDAREPQDLTPFLFWNDRILVDPRSHQVSKDGKVVDMTELCYGIVELLGRSPGRPYSNRELLAAVWRRNAPASNRTDTVRLRIHKIRKQLGEEAIETHYKAGYAAAA